MLGVQLTINRKYIFLWCLYLACEIDPESTWQLGKLVRIAWAFSLADCHDCRGLGVIFASPIRRTLQGVLLF